jgi:5-methyltetrahydropteroyltriglutamate--homocysteine methyltransferase
LTHAIRTTHVGSLPRSDALTAALIAQDAGHAPADLAEIVSQAVREVVQKQVEAGVDLPSDGEQGKIGYSTYVLDRLTGFSDGDVPRKPALDMAEHPDLAKKLAVLMGSQQFRRAACVGPVSLVSVDPFLEEIAVMREAMDAAGVSDGFLNAASPGLITAFLPNQYYAAHEDYLQALAEAMRPEYEAIVNAGFYLQLDCPDLAMSRHTGFQDLTEAEFLKRAEMHVEAMNWALRNVPADRVRMHVCWGNYEGPHDHDIDLRKIMGTVLKAKPAIVLFEGANPRHDHEWAIWGEADIPQDKVLVPGLIDSCSNYVEHPELVAQRIERYVAIVGPERVIAGTDCGFGTFAGYGKIDEGVVWKKLRALKEGAEIASRRLS